MTAITEMNRLRSATIVVAHPDDEALWMGSLLPSAEHIIVCFGPVPRNEALTRGREMVAARFPLPRVQFLNIVESRVFNRAAWPNPEMTPEGLAIRLAPSLARDYQRSFADLMAKLPVVLRGAETVVTHNPWGEYGHEHHVQLFRVLEKLQPVMKFNLWVTCYAGPKASGLVARQVKRLAPPSAPLAIDRQLVHRLRDLYCDTGSWTWYQDYQWPDAEWFFPLLPATQSAAAGDVRPLQWISQTFEAKSLPAREFDRAVAFARRRLGAAGMVKSI